MIAISILIGFLVFIWLLHHFQKDGLTDNQYSFLNYSTVFGFLILLGIPNLLFSQEGQPGLISDESIYPLLFYALWLYFSTMVGNKLTGRSSDMKGFDTGGALWVSKEDD